MELNNLSTTNRYKLLLVLGSKCRMCPISEIKELEIDHIYNDGGAERTKYGSSEKIWSWYLEHKDQAFRRLQPLCKEHHEEKHHPFFPLTFETIQGKPSIDFIKEQVFMIVLKNLEGDNKNPVEESLLVEELIKTGEFTKDESNQFGLKMLREGTILTMKPGSYNTT